MPFCNNFGTIKSIYDKTPILFERLINLTKKVIALISENFGTGL